MPQSVGLPLFDTINDALFETLAESFTLTRAGSGGESVEAEGVFDARHFAVELGGEVPVAEYQTTLACRRADVDPVAVGDAITVRETDYVVRDLRPDSEGIVVLVLARDE